MRAGQQCKILFRCKGAKGSYRTFYVFVIALALYGCPRSPSGPTPDGSVHTHAPPASSAQGPTGVVDVGDGDAGIAPDAQDRYGRLSSGGGERATLEVLSFRTERGAREVSAVQRIVKQNTGRYMQCYEKELRLNPSSAGTLELRFYINKEGITQNPNASRVSGNITPPMFRCMEAAVRGLAFPPMENDETHVVQQIAFRKVIF